MPDQGTHWGAVIHDGDHGTMRVERYADHEHAETVTDGCASGWAVPTKAQR
jgi:hypothetical protein